MQAVERVTRDTDITPDLPKRGYDAIVATLGYLALPSDEYFVLGGANLVLRGIKELTGDVDMLVTESVFANLRRRRGAEIHQPPRSAVILGADNTTVWVKHTRTPVPVSATTRLGDNYYPMSFESHKDKTELVDGFPCLLLEEVRKSKGALQRDRDLEDLQLIADYLGEELVLPVQTVPNPHEVSGSDFF